MKDSAWHRLSVVCITGIELGALLVAMALILGERADTVTVAVMIAAIMVLGALCIAQGNALYGRQSYLEQQDTALQFRSEVLNDFDKQLRRREWAVIWGEGKNR